MERVRPLMRVAGAVLPPALLALAAAGCVSAAKVDRVTASLKAAVAPTPPVPASQLICFWQRRLSSLPDPTREGAMTHGIAGQMFLISPDNKPADVNGDLTVVVYDETPRPPGTPPMRPEVWNYKKDVLKRLGTTDERFGRSYVVFLPWPPQWQDVSAVKIVGRYQTPGHPDLFAGEVHMTLDLSQPSGAPVWSEASQYQTTGVPNPASLEHSAKPPTAGQPLPPSAGRYQPAAGGVGSSIGPDYPGNMGAAPASSAAYSPAWPTAAPPVGYARPAAPPVVAAPVAPPTVSAPAAPPAVTPLTPGNGGTIVIPRGV
jgi:hypothetical protein